MRKFFTLLRVHMVVASGDEDPNPDLGVRSLTRPSHGTSHSNVPFNFRCRALAAQTLRVDSTTFAWTTRIILISSRTLKYTRTSLPNFNSTNSLRRFPHLRVPLRTPRPKSSPVRGRHEHGHHHRLHHHTLL